MGAIPEAWSDARICSSSTRTLAQLDAGGGQRSSSGEWHPAGNLHAQRSRRPARRVSSQGERAVPNRRGCDRRRLQHVGRLCTPLAEAQQSVPANTTPSSTWTTPTAPGVLGQTWSRHRCTTQARQLRQRPGGWLAVEGVLSCFGGFIGLSCRDFGSCSRFARTRSIFGGPVPPPYPRRDLHRLHDILMSPEWPRCDPRSTDPAT